MNLEPQARWNQGILIIKHEDRNSKVFKETENIWFKNLTDFANFAFDIKVTDDGKVIIDGDEDATYDVNKYTKEEILIHYIHSTMFGKYAFSKSYTAYNLFNEYRLIPGPFDN